jgi:hypothetical protein
MITFASLALVGIVISTGSMLGFLFAANTIGSRFGYICIVIYALATFFLFVSAARRMSANSLAALGLVVAVASVFVEQILAFSFFPGLVKDIPVLGYDHIMRLAIMLCATVLWYFIIAALSKRAIEVA